MEKSSLAGIATRCEGDETLKCKQVGPGAGYGRLLASATMYACECVCEGEVRRPAMMRSGLGHGDGAWLVLDRAATVGTLEITRLKALIVR